MARYTGPRARISRRLGVPIFGYSKSVEKRNYPPGQHGPKSRRKVTDYALGLSRSRRGTITAPNAVSPGLRGRAARRGVTGEQMLQLLETRSTASCITWALAAPPGARQMVGHGHVK
jgi:small subunit ribosomal protein S4